MKIAKAFLTPFLTAVFFLSRTRTGPVVIVAASPDLSLAVVLSTSPRPDWMSDIQFELATPNRAVTDRLTGVSGIWGR